MINHETKTAMDHAVTLGVVIGTLAAIVLIWTVAFALGQAVALPKVGACPSGYASGASYCTPMAGARHAIVKAGSCPPGYIQSGGYCLQEAKR